MMPIEPLANLRFENWRDLRTQLVWAYDGRIEETSRKMDYTGVPTPAWLLRKGSATLHFSDGKERIPTGVWYFPTAKPGHQEFSRDAELLSVRFIAEWPTGTPLFDRTQSIQVSLSEAPALTRIAERVARVISQRFPSARTYLPTLFGTPEDYFEIQRLHYGWLVAYAATMKGAGLLPQTIGTLDDRVRQALHQLEIRSLGQTLREGDLAKAVGLSRSQLNRVFVANLGQTPADYWEKKRLQAAQLAIIESTQSIKSIAYDLGFSSLPHFSAWVRKRLGRPPRELRKAKD